jgi:hypothetical protein
MQNIFLSKTTYLDGLKCLKLIWYRANAKVQIPVVDAATQSTFNYGHWIGEKAKQLFPGGVEEKRELPFKEHMAKSLELLKLRVPVFEGGYMADNLYARPDVLDPVGDDQWDIVEVKCGRDVHDVNCHDVAYLRHCYRLAGLSIHRCYLLHVREGVKVKADTPPEEAFVKVDITAKVDEHAVGIADRIAEIRCAMRLSECPGIALGPQCDHPYGCVMRPLCEQQGEEGPRDQSIAEP